jgi:hypothetical protein
MFFTSYVHLFQFSEILTKEDSRLFINVSVDEFNSKAWTPKLDSGVGVLTHRWNKLGILECLLMITFLLLVDCTGRWVASEIVNNGNHKQRVEIVKRFITIMDEIFKNNNFFTTMAIISGLNHSAVQRMKKTWRALPEKYQKDLQHLEQELSFSQSFKRYRELLADAVENQKPCIPFLAVHTKVFIILT